MRERQRRDRRRPLLLFMKSSQLWVLLLGGIFVLYCVFLVHLHFWTLSVNHTTANVLMSDNGNVNKGNVDHPIVERKIQEELDDGDLHNQIEQVTKNLRAEVSTTLAAAVDALAQEDEHPCETGEEDKAAMEPILATQAEEQQREAESEQKIDTAEGQPVQQQQEQPTNHVGEKVSPLPPQHQNTEKEETIAAEAPTRDDVSTQLVTLEKATVEEETNKLNEQNNIQAAQPPVKEEHVATAETQLKEQLNLIPETTEAEETPILTQRNAVVSLQNRYVTITGGYEATLSYLDELNKEEGIENVNVFLFFMCSDKHFQPHDWSTICISAKRQVHETFALSPGNNRLVTIFAGTERYWQYQNDFNKDVDLRVKTVPSLMKWEGKRRATIGMMIKQTLMYDSLLRYLFNNEDKVDPLLAAPAVQTKEIVTVSSYAAFTDVMNSYKIEENATSPLFLMFISGRLAGNNRPWCPYCRYSELPVEYAFKAYAPPNSRLIRVEVTPTYQQWRKPNDFNQDPALGLRGVPAMFRVHQLPVVQDILYERINDKRFDLLDSLHDIFTRHTKNHGQ